MIPWFLTSNTHSTQRDYAACDLMLKILIHTYLMCWCLSSKPFPEILEHVLLVNSQRLDSLLDIWSKHTHTDMVLVFLIRYLKHTHTHTDMVPVFLIRYFKQAHTHTDMVLVFLISAQWRRWSKPLVLGNNRGRTNIEPQLNKILNSMTKNIVTLSSLFCNNHGRNNIEPGLNKISNRIT